MQNKVGEISQAIPSITPGTRCERVDRIFKENPALHGVAVTENDYPIALIMRVRFYQRIGTLYGYTLYMERPVQLIMDPDPLVVDYDCPITEVSKLAMGRDKEKLYDDVVVTCGGQLYGAVSVRDLLLHFAEIQAETASFMNPLTGLPGNVSISEWLKGALTQEHYSVLYFDLDNFKAYNDTYGFKEGDRLLQWTADLIKNGMSPTGGLVGHIGGDDFIVVLDHHHYGDSCRSVLRAFDETIRGFYSEAHFMRQSVLAENRSGKLEEIPLVSLSVAVVTNRFRSFNLIEEIAAEAASLKKSCKLHNGSCLIDDSHLEPRAIYSP
ncbi:GGDEF domain-containing protein [Paenibacillus zanthoxyli]|uniref:GGDEF domain-containing protein n=1 Tax=Paenibacillus zanthoxyli TaxID=369399 RepID=UPI00047262FA|nr:diguanylate cyclase [Paenibacillus zanthoxyli]